MAMAISSGSLPAPVAAEASGAGSFFGSCQVEAGNFQAALAGAEGSLETGTGLDGLRQAMNGLQESNGKSDVLTLLEGLLGEDGAAAYAELTELLDEGALPIDENTGELDLGALGLVLQQLLAQLESMLAQTVQNPMGASSENGSAKLDGEALLDALSAESPQTLAVLQGQAKSLLAELQALSAESDDVDLVNALNLLTDIQDAGLAAVEPTVQKAQSELEPETDSQEPALAENAVLVDKAKDAVVPSSLDAVEETHEAFSEEDEDSSAVSAKSEQPVLETVTRFDGGELRLETVDVKTGAKVQSMPVVDQQQRIQEFEVVRQVAEKVRYMANQGSQRMTLQLNPEQLGQIDLRIVLKDGEMQVHASVNSDTAQQALESHVGLLRESLEKQNIVLERLEVSVDRQRADGSANNQQQQSGERNSRSRRQGGGSEGRLQVVTKRAGSETGRRLGYNTMEYLA
jgi:flagellar hook-length control protein FliK